LRLAAPPLAAQIGWLHPAGPKRQLQALVPARPAVTPPLREAADQRQRQLTYGIVFSAAAGLFHGYYLAVMAPALCALAGVGAGSLWVLYCQGRAPALWLPATIFLTGLWQVHVLEGYLGDTLAIGHGWLAPTLFGTTAALASGARHYRVAAARAGTAVCRGGAVDNCWRCRWPGRSAVPSSAAMPDSRQRGRPSRLLMPRVDAGAGHSLPEQLPAIPS
jgi:hypothetical protein